MLLAPLLSQPDAADFLAAMDAIFFAPSEARVFRDAADKAAFRERWLGRYLDRWPQLAWVARTDDGTLAGYLVGCLENPARSSAFDDIAYFRDFAQACARFPAHLHINLAERARGQGTGALLVEAFAAQAAEAGCLGVHIVTGAGARNMRFYATLGFSEIATAPWGAATVVFMGRPLSPA